MGKKCCILISGTCRLYNKYLIDFMNKTKSNNNLEVLDVIVSLNSESIDQEMIELLNPKKIYYNKVELPEKYLDVPKSRCSWPMRAVNTYSMYFNNYKAFKLLEEYQIENNFKYDYIIKYRSDLHSEDFLDLLQEENAILIPIGNDYPLLPATATASGGLNDQIAYGDFTSMKNYCYLYENLDNLIFNLKIIYHAETLLYHHLLNSNVKRFDYQYSIQRQ